MKVSTMRRIDAWAGVPLCLLGDLLRSVFGRRRAGPGEAAPVRSVLVIKLSELGALVTLEAALDGLAARVGRERVYFLSFAQSRPLLDVLDYAPRQNVFLLRTDCLRHLLWDGARAILRIRRLRVDCCLDLDFFSRATALIGWLSGCRRRVGCHAYFGEGPYRGSFLTHRVKFNPHIHVSQMFAVLARALDQPPGDLPRLDFVPGPLAAPRRRFQAGAAELDAVARLLRETGLGAEGALILFHSGLGDLPLRKWADERYAELARLILAGDPQAFVLVTGAAHEAPAAARLADAVASPRCRCVAGRTTLRELLALFGRADLLVTNDSGPAHFAALTDVATVVLFGPETPLLWRPLGAGVRIVSRGLACSPCFTAHNGRQSACRRNICMDISPAEVYAAVAESLARRARRAPEGAAGAKTPVVPPS
jgi:ADP-heptose:LPS heptosyltransferase